ncbi:hypothetical protein [Flavihumibacter sp. ZG627]|uniref:hypothetical protein n=1 Tax=Flavihumibacter sp. ZG627 TaxID=1463156 RepID=UPI00057D7487|nr:hypothetical protein [Flavihumibacter sp. ZG627]KIC90526.1 hypothetical protein HY58_11285 [Flavihumibacter sp. ZG627]
MLKILFFLTIIFNTFLVHAQQPQVKQTPELKQQIEELKKEITDLEAEIKVAEKSDPEEAAQLKKGLAALKNVLSMMGGTVTKQPVKTASVAAKRPAAAASPIVPIILKQPLSVPTAAQAKDNLLWYKGKKANDSTLITMTGMLVQYAKKKGTVVVQPPKKNDRFVKTVDELINNEKRKDEVAEHFVKMENGLLYYPLLVTSMAMYDDLASGFAAAVKNTIELPELRPLPAGDEESRSPEISTAENKRPTPEKKEDVKKAGDPAAIHKHINEQLALAKKLIQQLPPVASFPAPPARSLGFCGTCDTSLLARERRQDGIWLETYQGEEQRIAGILLGIERTKALLGQESNNSFAELLNPITARMEEKDNILLEKFGHDLRYSQIICIVVLGHERQRQLLGMGTESPSLLLPLMKKAGAAYKKYFDEQVEAKNHDFVLNMPFHIGVLRQRALLGLDEESNEFGDLVNMLLEYNRFAMTTEIDFIYEKVNDENEILLKATGTLESSVKKYTMLIADSCSFRMMPYSTDISNQTIEKVTMPMTVKSGAKTIRDEENKLVTYRYSGPESFPLQFPEFKIDFCNNSKSDTAFMTGFVGDESTAQQLGNAMSKTYKQYKADILIFANYVFYAGAIDEDRAIDQGNAILQTISNFQNQAPANTAMGKLKQQYEGKKQMDIQRQGLINTMANDKTTFLFTANNKSTVLIDKFNDFKKRIEDDTELKQGQIHLRIVHEPVR